MIFLVLKNEAGLSEILKANLVASSNAEESTKEVVQSSQNFIKTIKDFFSKVQMKEDDPWIAETIEICQYS